MQKKEEKVVKKSNERRKRLPLRVNDTDIEIIKTLAAKEDKRFSVFVRERLGLPVVSAGKPRASAESRTEFLTSLLTGKRPFPDKK